MAAAAVSCNSSAFTASLHTHNRQTLSTVWSFNVERQVQFQPRTSQLQKNVKLLRISQGSSITTPIVKVRAAADAPPLAQPKQKIRIKLRSYWVPIIEEASKMIMDAIKSTNAKPVGPIPLPTKRRIYCVLKSPHVNKDAREHFQRLTHRRLIEIENLNPQTIDALMQIDFPAGVDVEVKLP